MMKGVVGVFLIAIFGISTIVGIYLALQTSKIRMVGTFVYEYENERIKHALLAFLYKNRDDLLKYLEEGDCDKLETLFLEELRKLEINCFRVEVSDIFDA